MLRIAHTTLSSYHSFLVHAEGLVRGQFEVWSGSTRTSARHECDTERIGFTAWAGRNSRAHSDLRGCPTPMANSLARFVACNAHAATATVGRASLLWHNTLPFSPTPSAHKIRIGPASYWPVRNPPSVTGQFLSVAEVACSTGGPPERLQ